jgi:hypothetical protein
MNGRAGPTGTTLTRLDEKQKNKYPFPISITWLPPQHHPKRETTNEKQQTSENN